MGKANFSTQAIRDPRLAVYAAAAAPAWVWSLDGARILWANAAGRMVFNAPDDDALAARTFTPADPHRRQVMQTAARLPLSGLTRLERLRGFGAPLGNLMTCACSRLSLANNETGILVAAAQSAGRAAPFEDRVIALLDKLEIPAAAFTIAGAFIGGNAAALALTDFANAGPTLLDEISAYDVTSGAPFKTTTRHGDIAVHRIGTGSESTSIVLLSSRTWPHTLENPLPPVQQNAAPVVETSSHSGATQSGDAGTADTASVPPTDVVHAAELIAAAADAQTVTTEDADITTAMTDHSHQNEPEMSPPSAADEETPVPSPSDDVSSHDGAERVETTATAPTATPSADLPEDGPAQRRRHPLRFLWQMDADGRFTYGSDEFTRLIGARTASAFGRLWSEIAETLGLDPEHKVADAIATRDTFSGIVVPWPVDGFGARLAVELSGLPLFDNSQQFAGYRGFGICRDLDGLTRLAAQRRHDTLFGSRGSWSPVPAAPANDPSPAADSPAPDPALPASDEPVSDPTPAASLVTMDHIVEPPLNVVPFRPAGEPKTPALTPVETNAFQEIARQLSARLEQDGEAPTESVTSGEPAPDTMEATPAQPEDKAQDETPHVAENRENGHATQTLHLQPAAAVPTPPAAPDLQLFDRLPVGMLVYRLDRLIYANQPFLNATGYHSLSALTEAGGLDALYVEPGASGSAEADGGAPVTISTERMSATSAGLDARLHSITWDGDSALALILTPYANVPPLPAPEAIAAPPAQTPPDDSVQAEELATILETTAEGVLIFDSFGRIQSGNRSAEALFGRSSTEFSQRNLIDLFAPESQRAVIDYLESLKTAGVESLLEQGRDVLGATASGGAIPLSITMGRTRPEGARFFAIFRDKAPLKTAEPEAAPAVRIGERMAAAKADMLSRISHEIRTPLNAIIGFAEVMIEERFGALGNERYVDYMKDIRASGERVIAIIDDMLDLSRIESGKLDLTFIDQDLNPLIEQCVAVMQPQANRERIIIRTSLTHTLPSVRADARALRQIALNLIGCSIHLANAGGQVIVSTALSDLGDVVLRIRDTGHGLNDNEIAAAMAPFRTPAPSDQINEESGTNLSLTKALVEANRGRFNIKSAPNAGTLIEVVFAQAGATA